LKGEKKKNFGNDQDHPQEIIRLSFEGWRQKHEKRKKKPSRVGKKQPATSCGHGRAKGNSAKHQDLDGREIKGETTFGVSKGKKDHGQAGCRPGKPTEKNDLLSPAKNKLVPWGGGLPLHPGTSTKRAVHLRGTS